MRAHSSVSLVAVLVLAVALGSQQQVALAQGEPGLLGGLGSVANGIVGGVTNSLGLGGVGRLTNSIINTPINLVNQVTRPLSGVLSGNGAGSSGAYQSYSTNSAAGNLVSSTAGSGATPTGSKFNEITEHPLGDSIQLGSGMLDGLVSGTAAGVGLGGVSSRSSRLGAANAAAMMAAGRAGSAGLFGGTGSGLPAAEAARNLDSNGAFGGYYGSGGVGQGIGRGLMNGGAAQAANLMAAGEQVRGAAEVGAAMGAAQAGSNTVAAAAPVAAATAANAASAANNVAAHRQMLANDALANAHAESAIAGADMVAHGINNARSASLASNAYRQAKLATARDRVNIAGTIQNSARISDAAIATHDSATKAEDSLLGSEIAVDSAATVLDSDAAYIPPVTNSMLRSLPYGRVGLRNIIPKPLTYPSVLLPDVWLNGRPVNYQNIPLRMIPIGPLGLPTMSMGGPAAANGFMPPYFQAATSAAGFPLVAANGQPLISNNGILINGMVVDPYVAYLTSNNMQGILGSSVLPILANGQLEAQDEVSAAHALTQQQLNGNGFPTTYYGFGRSNSVPMLTGSVTDVSLAPTTTVGTTYPIGSAMVIEPRDSFFQDYIDNASSRQNWDEKHQ